MSSSEARGPGAAGRPSEVRVLAPSTWLWLVPSASFALVCGGLTAVATETAHHGVVVALLAVAAAVVLGWRVAGGPRESATEAGVPLLLLVAAALLNGSTDGTATACLLVAGLPTAWLAFTYGRIGTALGVTGTVIVGAAPFVAGTPFPSDPVERLDVVLPVVAIVGMAVVTNAASRVLAATRADLVTRADALDLEAVTTRAVLDAVDAAVVVFVTGRAPVSNRQARELLDRSGMRLDPAVDGVVAAGTRVLGPDHVTPVAPDQQAPVRAAHGESFHGVLQWVGGPGAESAMLCSAHPIIGASVDGSAAPVEVGMLFVAWDATELLDSMRVREEFLATVSHELRTPLTSVLGYLEMHEDAVADGVGSDRAQRYLRAVRRNAESLHDRIEQLLVVAQPDRTADLEVVDLTDLVVSTTSEHRVASSRAGLALDVLAPEQLWVRVDPTAMRRVVDNLVSNAIKYTRRGSVTVTVLADVPSAEPSTPSAPVGFVIEVADTGVGMSEHEQRHAFDRFYRAEGATREAVPGLGIGLAVTRQLVESHGGSIAIVSRPGWGTTFVVTVASS